MGQRPRSKRRAWASIMALLRGFVNWFRSNGAQRAPREAGPLDPVSALGEFAGRLAKDASLGTLNIGEHEIADYLGTVSFEQVLPSAQDFMADLCAYVEEKGIELTTGTGRPNGLCRIVVTANAGGLVFTKVRLSSR